MAPELPVSWEAVTTRFTKSGPLAVIAQRQDPQEFYDTARVLDLTTGATVGEAMVHNDNITCADLSADGSKVAVGSEDGIVMIRDARTGLDVAPPLPDNGRVTSVRFSDEGRSLVIVSAGEMARVWDIASGNPRVATLKHDGIWFAQFSPTADRVVTISGGPKFTACIWTSGGDFIVPLQHTGPVEYAEFSPDGSKVVTASGDRTARIWNASTGKQLTEEPLEHAEAVLTARFSPDGLRVITASKDGTAQVWDAETGLKLGDPFRHRDDVVSAAFSGDNRRAITGSIDRTAAIRDVPKAPHPIPEWLADLAEGIGGQRLNGDRVPEPVTWDEYVELKARLAKFPVTDPLVGLAQGLVAEPDD
jgi:WD40 repeat protein